MPEYTPRNTRLDETLALVIRTRSPFTATFIPDLTDILVEYAKNGGRRKSSMPPFSEKWKGIS